MNIRAEEEESNENIEKCISWRSKLFAQSMV